MVMRRLAMICCLSILATYVAPGCALTVPTHPTAPGHCPGSVLIKIDTVVAVAWTGSAVGFGGLATYLEIRGDVFDGVVPTYTAFSVASATFALIYWLARRSGKRSLAACESTRAAPPRKTAGPR